MREQEGGRYVDERGFHHDHREGRACWCGFGLTPEERAEMERLEANTLEGAGKRLRQALELLLEEIRMSIRRLFR